MNECSLRRPLKGVGGLFERAMVRGGLAKSQASFAPNDAGQLLDEMLLGRPMRRMLRGERLDQRAVFVFIFSGQGPCIATAPRAGAH